MARVPYVGEADLPEEYRHMIASQTVREGENMHVLQAIANNLPLLAARREYGAALREESGLSEREREMVILTVADHVQSRYIWHQHARFAMGSIVTQTEVVALAAREYEPFDDDEAALVRYVRQFVDGEVDDDAHDAIATHYDVGEVVGIGMIAMGYVGLALGADAFGVEIEEDEFVGWDLRAR